MSEQLVLAVSAALNGPLQGHRLTPLVQSNKAGRSSNERKNRSVLFEASSSTVEPNSHKSETKIGEPAQKLIGVDLQSATFAMSGGSSEHQLIMRPDESSLEQ